jgi:hypothetical protein
MLVYQRVSEQLHTNQFRFNPLHIPAKKICHNYRLGDPPRNPEMSWALFAWKWPIRTMAFTWQDRMRPRLAILFLADWLLASAVRHTPASPAAHRAEAWRWETYGFWWGKTNGNQSFGESLSPGFNIFQHPLSILVSHVRSWFVWAPLHPLSNECYTLFKVEFLKAVPQMKYDQTF